MRLLFLFCLLLCLPVQAQTVPVPALGGRVTDLTGTLSSEQRARLEAQLQSFESRKGAQLAVLIVPTTGSETVEQYALRVAENWKLGRKGVDDGALLLVAKEDRALRIEVGYGLEGILPDVIAKRIISEVIVPHLRQGDFAGGIEAGVQQMMRVVDGEALPAPKTTRYDGSWIQFLPVLFVIFLLLGGVFRALFGRLIGAGIGGTLVALLIWVVSGVFAMGVTIGFFVFMFILAGGFGFRGTAAGSRGFGGFGGGGFGGFSGGGGSFGGGGASGRW